MDMECAAEIKPVRFFHLDLLVNRVLSHSVEPQQQVGREDQHQARPASHAACKYKHIQI